MARSPRENYRKRNSVKEEREADIRIIEKQLKEKNIWREKEGERMREAINESFSLESPMFSDRVLYIEILS